MTKFENIVAFLKAQAEGLRPYAEICEEEGATDLDIYIEWDRWNEMYKDARAEYLAMV